MPSALLTGLRNALRVRHYSYRTERTYVDWVKRFIRFHGLRHPRELGPREISRFLTWLATSRGVSSATQSQALSAITFLYVHVLHQPVERLADVERASKRRRLPSVFSEPEVARVLGELEGQYWLMAALLYGSGLRLMECVRLRAKDIDFHYRCLQVREGKGGKDRIVTPADGLIEPLRAQLQTVARIHERDLLAGAMCGVITSIRAACSGRCAGPSAVPASRARRAVTPSGIPSPPLCWRTGRTSAPSRSSSDIGICAPPRSTPICWSVAAGRWSVR